MDESAQAVGEASGGGTLNSDETYCNVGMRGWKSLETDMQQTNRYGPGMIKTWFKRLGPDHGEHGACYLGMLELL